MNTKHIVLLVVVGLLITSGVRSIVNDGKLNGMAIYTNIDPEYCAPYSTNYEVSENVKATPGGNYDTKAQLSEGWTYQLLAAKDGVFLFLEPPVHPLVEDDYRVLLIKQTKQHSAISSNDYWEIKQSVQNCKHQEITRDDMYTHHYSYYIPLKLIDPELLFSLVAGECMVVVKRTTNSHADILMPYEPATL